MPIAAATRFIVLGGLAAYVALIATLLLIGGINTRYLLHGLRRDGTYYFSPERVQLLVATLIVAATYLEEAAMTASSGKMPEVPAWWLAGLGGSQTIYLTGKAFRQLGIGRTRSPRDRIEP